MIDVNASDVAKYNVILGMHQAKKWSQLPTEENPGTTDQNQQVNAQSNDKIQNKGKNTPKTEDEANIALWFGLMLAAGTGIIAARRRKAN